MKLANLLVLFVLVANICQAQEANTLVVHEWGTITTQHRADGTPNGRLNRIAPSDVLPDFVHRYEPETTRANPQSSLTKSAATPGRPDVTMRLETPVLYFYPPKQWNANATFNVDVQFRGGVINEFYPNAKASVALDADRMEAKQAAGVIRTWNGVNLDNYVIGYLQWQGIALGNAGRLPTTDSHVWLAPRNVNASTVRASRAESEKYLFYRGVAHLDALMQTQLTADALHLRAPTKLHWMPRPSMTIANIWLVDIRPDGSAAMRTQDKLVVYKAGEAQALARLARFAASDYSTQVIVALRQSMKQRLLAAGLFEDEAEAMLETWKDSYFRQPGLRVFYTVPQEWMEYFLPLRISVPHRLTRVLIGRIDLLSH